MLKENIINGAFFSVFKSINQNSSKDLNHTLGLTLSADSLVLFNFEDWRDNPLLWSISLTSKPTEDSCLASTRRGIWQSLENLAIKLFPDFSVSSLYIQIDFCLEHLFIWAQEKPHLKLLETNTTQTILSQKKKKSRISISNLSCIFEL